MSLLGLQRAGSGPVLVWLHGFTQTRDSAHLFRSILAGACEVLTIDLPGHGENASVSASLDETADLLADALPDDSFVLGGYSMGGRVALHFARRHPSRLLGLVVLSTTLGIRNEADRAARRERDSALGARIERIGARAFVDEWLAQPMFATLPHDPRERAARSHHAQGLADSLRRSGTGTQPWLGDQLADFAAPALIIAGANDQKYVSEAAILHETLANSSTAIVANAGHAAHLEQPAKVAALVIESAPIGIRRE